MLCFALFSKACLENMFSQLKKKRFKNTDHKNYLNMHTIFLMQIYVCILTVYLTYIHIV